MLMKISIDFRISDPGFYRYYGNHLIV